MSTPIAEDFSRIATELKRIESEKAKLLATPSPEEAKPEQSWAWASSAGWGNAFVSGDYDPA